MFKFLVRLAAMLAYAVMAAPFFSIVLDDAWEFGTTGTVPQLPDISSKAFIIRLVFATPLLLHLLGNAIIFGFGKKTHDIKPMVKTETTNAEIEEVLTDMRECLSDWHKSSTQAISMLSRTAEKATSLVTQLQEQRALYADSNRAAFTLPELWEAKEAVNEDIANALDEFVNTWQPNLDESYSYDQDEINNWRKDLKAALLGERAKMAVQTVSVSSVSQARSGVVFQEQPGGGGTPTAVSGMSQVEWWKPSTETPPTSPWARPQ